MSFLLGAKSAELDQFGGTQSLLDPVSLPKNKSIIAQNCRYRPGMVRTREGFGPMLAQAGLVNIFYWQQALSGTNTDYLVMLTTVAGSTTIILYNLDTSAAICNLQSGLANVAIGMFAPYGKQLYFVTQNSSNGSSNSAYVWDGTTTSSPAANKAFSRALLTTEMTVACADGASSVPGVDAGVHLVAAVFTDQTGYTQKPSPITVGDVLSSTSYTAPGSKALTVTLHWGGGGNWPSNLASVQILMTPVLNPQQWLVVPNSLTAVPASAADIVITVNYSDLTLTSIATDASDLFNLVSQNHSGTAPFNPKLILPWGNRMVWGTTYGGNDVLFVSEPNQPQYITANRHLLQLPSGLPISAMVVLGGNLYVMSSAGRTFAYSDNGQYPVSFTQPYEVDGKVGTAAPFGVSSSTGLNYFLCASPQGLYLSYGTTYQPIPLSYYQFVEWNAIDWTKPQQIFLKQFPQEKLLTLSVPLKTGGTSLYVWDYTIAARAGALQPQFIDFSNWLMHSQTMGCIEIGQNPTAKVWELWGVTSTNAGGIVGICRLKSLIAGDGVLYRDTAPDSSANTGIPCGWSSPLMPSGSSDDVLYHFACKIRAAYPGGTGSGNLYILVNTIDNPVTLVIPAASPMAIGNKPKQKYIFTYDMQTEAVSYYFTNGTLGISGDLDNAFLISGIEHFYNLMALQR